MDIPTSQGFNLKFGLSILFIDLVANRRRGLYEIDPPVFFSSNRPIWMFIQNHVKFTLGTPAIDTESFHDILRIHSMGYLHVLNEGMSWNALNQQDKATVVASFRRTVVRLKPALVVICGKETYACLFHRVGGSAKEGLMDSEIFWDEDFQNSTKVFLLRKTYYRNQKKEENVGRELYLVTKELSRLKRVCGIAHPLNLPVRQRVPRMKQVVVGFEIFLLRLLNGFV